MNTREVKIYFLMKDMLCKWKILCVWSLVGMLIFGIVGYFITVNKNENVLNDIKQISSLEDIEASLSNRQIDKVNQLIRDENAIKEWELFLANELGFNDGVSYDDNVRSEQVEVQNIVNESKDIFIYELSKLSSDELVYYTLKCMESSELEEYYKAQKVALEEQLMNVNIQIVKWIVTGLVLSTILFAGWRIILFLFGSRFHKGDDVEKIYQLPCLANITFSDTKKDEIELLNTKLKTILKNTDTNELMVIQSCDDSSLELLLNSIGKELNEAGVKSLYLKNILRDIKSIEQLDNNKSSILVEHVGVSKYVDVQKTIAFLEQQKINILGLVIVE